MGNILDGIQRPLRVRPPRLNGANTNSPLPPLGNPTGLSVHLHSPRYQYGRFGP